MLRQNKGKLYNCLRIGIGYSVNMYLVITQDCFLSSYAISTQEPKDVCPSPDP